MLQSLFTQVYLHTQLMSFRVHNSSNLVILAAFYLSTPELGSSPPPSPLISRHLINSRDVHSNRLVWYCKYISSLCKHRVGAGKRWECLCFSCHRKEKYIISTGITKTKWWLRCFLIITNRIKSYCRCNNTSVYKCLCTESFRKDPEHDVWIVWHEGAYKCCSPPPPSLPRRYEVSLVTRVEPTS